MSFERCFYRNVNNFLTFIRFTAMLSGQQNYNNYIYAQF